MSEIIKSILWPTLLACLIVFGFEYAERFLLHFNSADSFPELLGTRLDQQKFVSLLVGIASVEGVFLALFFTTVSVVASTAYALGPGDLRGLLLKEKFGSIYIGVLAFTIAVCLLLLGRATFGHSLSSLNLLLVITLAVFSVLSSVRLGMRALHFFDPVILIEHIVPSLLLSIRAVTPTGFAWLDPSFQAHHQKNAENHLSEYQSIVEVVSTRERSQGEAYLILAERALELLMHYSERKHYVPSESLWFKQINEYGDWLTADSSHTSIALASDTGMQPKIVNDTLWFETQILHIVQKVLRTQMKWKESQGALFVASRLSSAVGHLASQLAVDEAAYFLREVKPEIKENILSAANAAGALDSPDRIGSLQAALAILEAYLMAPIAMLLRFSTRVQEITPVAFSEIITGIQWEKHRTLYGHTLPRVTLRELEELQKCIDFERKVEGSEITPQWYQLQIAALSFVRSIEMDLDTLLQTIEDNADFDVEEWPQPTRYSLGVLLIERNLELYNKLSAHIPAIYKCLIHLGEFRKISDIPWPELKAEEVERRIEQGREALIIRLATFSEKLSPIRPTSQIPDYFGYCYSVLANECYSAMANKKEDLFGRTFPAYLNATISAHQRLQHDLRDQKPETAAIYSTDPLMDLLEISGLACVYSEMDGGNFWTTVKKAWDGYLDKSDNPAGLRDSLMAIVNFRSSDFGLSPGKIKRSGWLQNITARIRELGIFADPYGRYEPADQKVKLRHTSAIVRAFTTSEFLSHDGSEVFVAVYLLNKGGDDPETGSKAGSFLDSLLREQSKESEHEREDDPTD